MYYKIYGLIIPMLLYNRGFMYGVSKAIVIPIQFIWI